jgi:hypothetical protein
LCGSSQPKTLRALAFATAPICSNYRGPHRQWPVALKSEPIEKTQ